MSLVGRSFLDFRENSRMRSRHLKSSAQIVPMAVRKVLRIYRGIFGMFFRE